MAGILTEMTMQASKTLVQVFTRPPVPGGVKTRLIPALGEEGAAQLHSMLTQRIIDELIASKLPVELWCASQPDHVFFSKFNLDCYEQQGDDLGQRMHHALIDGLTRATKVVLVGTDLPPIDSSYIRRALASLNEHEVVLGPAEDGGYGLVGVINKAPEIFKGITWGGSDVLSTTCHHLNAQHLSYELLPPVWDVDTPEDLARYQLWLDASQANEAFGP